MGAGGVFGAEELEADEKEYALPAVPGFGGSGDAEDNALELEAAAAGGAWGKDLSRGGPSEL